LPVSRRTPLVTHAERIGGVEVHGRQFGFATEA
jgi:hypothetical protein